MRVTNVNKKGLYFSLHYPFPAVRKAPQNRLTRWSKEKKKKKKKSVVGLTAVAASVTWRRMRFEAEGRLVKSIRCVMFRQRLGDGCLSTGFQLQQAAGR